MRRTFFFLKSGMHRNERLRYGFDAMPELCAGNRHLPFLHPVFVLPSPRASIDIALLPASTPHCEFSAARHLSSEPLPDPNSSLFGRVHVRVFVPLARLSERHRAASEPQLTGSLDPLFRRYRSSRLFLRICLNLGNSRCNPLLHKDLYYSFFSRSFISRCSRASAVRSSSISAFDCARALSAIW